MYCREPPSKTTVGGPRKWDLSGLCPFPPKKMTWCEHMGGKRIRSGGGGLKTFFGRGFMVCFQINSDHPHPPY